MTRLLEGRGGISELEEKIFTHHFLGIPSGALPLDPPPNSPPHRRLTFLFFPERNSLSSCLTEVSDLGQEWVRLLSNGQIWNFLKTFFRK